MTTSATAYPNEYAGYFKLLRQHVLAFPRCESCGKFHWYPKPLCPACGSGDISWQPAPSTGRLFSWSVVHRKFDPDFLKEPPYVVGLITFDGMPGIRLVSNIDDCSIDELRIGLEVEASFTGGDVQIHADGSRHARVIFRPARRRPPLPE